MTTVFPSLDAFVQAAAAGEYIDIRNEPNGPAVIATGRAPSGRRVDWVDPSQPGALPPGMADATRAFLAALEAVYGERITNVVRKELGLSSGQHLPSPLVRRAVEMAKASQSMFSGFNFMSRLHFSAVRGGAELDAACAAAGIEARKMGPGQKALADELFGRSFEAAAKGDTVQIEVDEARPLFREAVARAIAVPEGQAAALTAGRTEGTGGSA
ncbi:hypothetical protein [Telmatospirillum sp. J64-1]|uniref:hypothetical protein n=1 Tax=Telmatospirillum sp. J64-1 TaxID=2502183 RepID=UPI00115F25BC|nr:hypothetical protein [Telmatospirillum sp. J64-1]